MIPKSFIQDLLNRLDIVDVIERYVPLKKAGANYVACCPFHNEKSPSFTVSQSKQFYHCFGCGAHGTAISFVMEHTGRGFVEAVEDLAQGLGLPVPRETTQQSAPKVAPDLYELMQSATRYYREQLKVSPRAITYLKKRGLSGEVAARFGIGYAPDAWQSLTAVVSNYQDASLVATGLVIEGEAGKRYDRFRDRIMFPIVNARGQVIGFGGRILDQGEPKYLNSPETALFEKGHELYGLYQAQKAIRAQQRVVVVEGYMDVVALAQKGVDYAVATLGTATTPHHVQKLLRLSEQVVFCFDGDKAGRKAAWRALENALPQLVDGKRIGFLFLPEEHDPDTYIREFGREAFEQALEDSLPLSGYLLRELTDGLDLRTAEGRQMLLQKAQPLLVTIAAPATALLLRKEVAVLAGVTQEELEGLYKIQPVATPSQKPRPPAKATRQGLSVQKQLLRFLVTQPELAREMPRNWQGEGAEGEAITAIVDWIHEAAEEMTTVALSQQFQGTVHEPAINAAQVESMSWSAEFNVGAEFTGMMRKLRKEAVDAEMAQLLSQRLDQIDRTQLEQLRAESLQLRQQVQ